MAELRSAKRNGKTPFCVDSRLEHAGKRSLPWQILPASKLQGITNDDYGNLARVGRFFYEQFCGRFCLIERQSSQAHCGIGNGVIPMYALLFAHNADESAVLRLALQRAGFVSRVSIDLEQAIPLKESSFVHIIAHLVLIFLGFPQQARFGSPAET